MMILSVISFKVGKKDVLQVFFLFFIIKQHSYNFYLLIHSHKLLIRLDYILIVLFHFVRTSRFQCGGDLRGRVDRHQALRHHERRDHVRVVQLAQGAHIECLPQCKKDRSIDRYFLVTFRCRLIAQIVIQIVRFIDLPT